MFKRKLSQTWNRRTAALILVASSMKSSKQANKITLCLTGLIMRAAKAPRWSLFILARTIEKMETGRLDRALQPAPNWSWSLMWSTGRLTERRHLVCFRRLSESCVYWNQFKFEYNQSSVIAIAVSIGEIKLFQIAFVFQRIAFLIGLLFF